MESSFISWQLDAQMKLALEQQAELDASFEPGAAAGNEIELMRASYAHARRFWNADAPEVAVVDERSVDGPHGPVPLRIYRPRSTLPGAAIVFMHGGGWVVGNLDTHDKVMRLLALDSGITVVGVDYRLSPEHRFPVALEECTATIAALHEGRVDGLDASWIGLCGDSAGASLAAGCVVAGEAGGAAIGALALYYGVYGLRDSASRRLYDAEALGLTRADMNYYEQQYLGDMRQSEDPRFNVLGTDLRRWPPAYLGYANLDVLADDSVVLGNLLHASGVEVRLTCYEGVLHGFLHLSRMVDKGRQAIGDGARFLRRQCKLATD